MRIQVRIVPALALTVLSAIPGIGQQLFSLQLSEVCSYFGEAITDAVYTFASDTEAEELIDEIMGHAGLPANFTVRAANVPNAAAVIENQQRVILYSQSFVRDLRQRTGSEWAATSVMAHEIGHHLSGHTLSSSGSRPPIELEADVFSGHILAQMGATLDQALVVMRTFAGTATETHPPQSARLAAIENGWRSATDRMTRRPTGVTDIPASPPPPPPDRPAPTPPAPTPVAEPVVATGTAPNLTGTWINSVGSVLEFSPSGPGRYSVVEYVVDFIFGGISEGGRGTASVVDATISIRMNYAALDAQVTCRDGFVLDDTMIIDCIDAIGLPFQMYLEREY